MIRLSFPLEPRPLWRPRIGVGRWAVSWSPNEARRPSEGALPRARACEQGLEEATEPGSAVTVQFVGEAVPLGLDLGGARALRFDQRGEDLGASRFDAEALGLVSHAAHFRARLGELLGELLHTEFEVVGRGRAPIRPK